MFLDDALENRRIAVPVPGAFGIDDGNRSALANPKAVCFCPQDAALLRQPKLLQPALEKLQDSLRKSSSRRQHAEKPASEKKPAARRARKAKVA